MLLVDGNPVKQKPPIKPANVAGPSKSANTGIADNVDTDDAMDGNKTSPARTKKTTSKKSGTTVDARTKGKKRKVDLKGKRRARESSSSDSESDSSHSDSESDSDLVGDTNGKKDDTASSSDESDIEIESAKAVAVKSPHRKVLDDLDALLNKVEREAAPEHAKTAVYEAFNKFSRRMGRKVTDFVQNREISMAMNDYYFERIGLKSAIPEGLAVRKNAGTKAWHDTPWTKFHS